MKFNFHLCGKANVLTWVCIAPAVKLLKWELLAEAWLTKSRFFCLVVVCCLLVTLFSLLAEAENQ
ncbi:hypothetical protein FK519_29945 [Klebsiella pneumoniae]|nr:hypothetical protein [Klebsiella pneumoniae]